jgi:hypothetical protein
MVFCALQHYDFYLGGRCGMRAVQNRGGPHAHRRADEEERSRRRGCPGIGSCGSAGDRGIVAPGNCAARVLAFMGFPETGRGPGARACTRTTTRPSA